MRQVLQSTTLMSHVQWFPGHMRRAVRGIEQRIRRADLVIEVLDARAPHSTHSPLLAELASGKRVLRVLAKHDLADTDATASWLRSYASGTALQRRTVVRRYVVVGHNHRRNDVC